MILRREFYKRDTLTVAKELLGKYLVHESPEGVTIGKIVETEAYMGPEDKASHAYGNLRTKRTEVQFGPKGHVYIYQVYGMYYCFNVSSGGVPGKPEAILVRALEPVSGVEIMMKRRGASKGQTANLTSGPGRRARALKPEEILDLKFNSEPLGSFRRQQSPTRVAHDKVVALHGGKASMDRQTSGGSASCNSDRQQGATG